MILGADCFYSSEHCDELLATVHWFLHSNGATGQAGHSTDGPVFYTTYQERSIARTIRILLLKWRLHARVVDVDGFLPEKMLEDQQYTSIHLLEIRAIQQGLPCTTEEKPASAVI